MGLITLKFDLKGLSESYFSAIDLKILIRNFTKNLSKMYYLYHVLSTTGLNFYFAKNIKSCNGHPQAK